jgi:Zn-dependent protease
MKWSWPIARFAGIDVKIHATFLLIVLLGAVQWSHFGVSGMVFGAVLILALFLCVTLHEFGHSLVAQRFGIPVREIVLLPIGGVAALARNPSKPLHELLIAAAGPAVNVVLALALGLVLGLNAAWHELSTEHLVQSFGESPSLTTALVWLLNVNIALVLFNLIPAFPMDGGRILRGLLGFVTDWGRATRIAAVTGQVIAVGMFLLALFAGQAMLGIIAAFIFLAAGSTYAEEQARSVLSTCRVGDAYNKHALTLAEHDRVSRVLDYLLTSYQPDFAVLRGRELRGVVLRERVLEALRILLADATVDRLMLRDVPSVQAELSLHAVSEQMQDAQCRVAAVYHGSHFVGLVSSEDLAEAQLILSFARKGANRDDRGASPHGQRISAVTAGRSPSDEVLSNTWSQN